MYILTEKTSEAKSDIPFKKIWGKSLIVSEGKWKQKLRDFFVAGSFNVMFLFNTT